MPVCIFLLCTSLLQRSLSSETIAPRQQRAATSELFPSDPPFDLSRRFLVTAMLLYLSSPVVRARTPIPLQSTVTTVTSSRAGAGRARSCISSSMRSKRRAAPVAWGLVEATTTSSWNCKQRWKRKAARSTGVCHVIWLLCACAVVRFFALVVSGEKGVRGQGRTEARWRPGQEASLAPPCSNQRSFDSKCTVLKKLLAT